MARNGIFALRVSLGIVFLWFGALKFIPGLSAADERGGGLSDEPLLARERNAA
jgi:hypothetical protein